MTRRGLILLAALSLTVGSPARAENCMALSPEPPTKEIVIPQAADVLLVGDSIAAGWPRVMLEAVFPGHRVGKIAVSGERVQQTRWKLDSGRFDHLAPRIVILVVGTNNLGKNQPCAISGAVLQVVADIRQRWKPEHLIVFGILPRGIGGEFQKAARLEINAALKKGLAGQAALRFIDLDDKMSCAPCAPFRPDNTHLTTDGYRIMTDAVR